MLDGCMSKQIDSAHENAIAQREETDAEAKEIQDHALPA